MNLFYSLIPVMGLQVGRSLYLLGKYRAADEVYSEALKLQEDDAELWLSKGVCAVQLRNLLYLYVGGTTGVLLWKM